MRDGPSSIDHCPAPKMSRAWRRETARRCGSRPRSPRHGRCTAPTARARATRRGSVAVAVAHVGMPLARAVSSRRNSCVARGLEMSIDWSLISCMVTRFFVSSRRGRVAPPCGTTMDRGMLAVGLALGSRIGAPRQARGRERRPALSSATGRPARRRRPRRARRAQPRPARRAPADPALAARTPARPPAGLRAARDRLRRAVHRADEDAEDGALYDAVSRARPVVLATADVTDDGDTRVLGSTANVEAPAASSRARCFRCRAAACTGASSAASPAWRASRSWPRARRAERPRPASGRTGC